MTYVLFDPPNHGVEHTQHQSIIKWKIIICNQTYSSHEDTRQSYEDVAQIALVPTLVAMSFVSKHAHVDS